MIGIATAIALLIVATPYWMSFFIFRPQPLPTRSHGLHAQAVAFDARDGSRLVSWWVPPRGQPVLLFLHGRSGNAATRRHVIARLAEQGFGVLAVDYRGYGASEGRPSEVAFAEDAESAYSWLVENGVQPAQIVVLGQSLGNAAAMKLASRRPVAAVALISPFTSLPEAAVARHRWLPVGAMLWRTNRFEVQDYVAAFDRPLFFAVARDDELIRPSNSAAVIASARNPITVEAKGGHEGLLGRVVDSGALQRFTIEAVDRKSRS
jgi:pimeloyl-ACP methyl ester carboxylesterase